MTCPDPADPAVPQFRDEATAGARSTSGASAGERRSGDLDNDGWLDIVQANGMVDDRSTGGFRGARDYWYVNHKLMRSGPEIHTYADMWGDLRGYASIPTRRAACT